MLLSEADKALHDLTCVYMPFTGNKLHVWLNKQLADIAEKGSLTSFPLVGKNRAEERWRSFP
jgi:hypothetical protein